MQFKKYQHIEKIGNEEVEGIEVGECNIFPKIDGTNGQVYLKDGIIMAGSRNRELTIDNDNGGFYKYVLENENIKNYLNSHPTHRLYGEFLIPHTLKTYRDDSWRKFYVFDVTIDTEDSIKYIPYEVYKPMLEEFNIEYIPIMFKANSLNLDQLLKNLDKNTFLIKDGSGFGEGLVVKNYDFYNKYGRQTWGKLVANEFKEKHCKNSTTKTIDTELVEMKFVDDCCTESFINKEYDKIRNENGFNQKDIPRLLNTIFYTLVNEELWNFIKKNKNPKIDFKLVNNFIIKKVKEIRKDIFS